MTVARNGGAPASDRLNLRVRPEAGRLLRRAAALEHKTLSAFVLEAACARAQETIDAQQRLVIDEAEFNRVLDELEQPPAVVEPLLNLAARVARHDPR